MLRLINQAHTHRIKDPSGGQRHPRFILRRSDDTIPTKNGRELVEILVCEEVTNYETKLAENCCLVRTQHNFCTQQLRYVGINIIYILFG